MEKVEHLLRDLIREEASRQVSIDSIQRPSRHTDVRLADMTSRRRPASIAFPPPDRYVSQPLADKGSLMEIGEALRRTRPRNGHPRLQESWPERIDGEARSEGNASPASSPNSGG